MSPTYPDTSIHTDILSKTNSPSLVEAPQAQQLSNFPVPTLPPTQAFSSTCTHLRAPTSHQDPQSTPAAAPNLPEPLALEPNSVSQHQAQALSSLPQWLPLLLPQPPKLSRQALPARPRLRPLPLQQLHQPAQLVLQLNTLNVAALGLLDVLLA